MIKAAGVEGAVRSARHDGLEACSQARQFLPSMNQISLDNLGVVESLQPSCS